VLALIVLGLRYYLMMPNADPLALTLIEHNGQLQVQWNHSARPVIAAVRGSLVIRDGQQPHTFPLTPQELEQGSYSYQRTSDNVDVRLSVENANGGKVEESSTFLGAGSGQPDPGEKAKTEKERSDMQAEIDRLQTENATQAKRIQELELNLKIMQSRLGAQ
jgi:hypothetical protein